MGIESQIERKRSSAVGKYQSSESSVAMNRPLAERAAALSGDVLPRIRLAEILDGKAPLSTPSLNQHRCVVRGSVIDDEPFEIAKGLTVKALKHSRECVCAIECGRKDGEGVTYCVNAHHDQRGLKSNSTLRRPRV